MVMTSPQILELLNSFGWLVSYFAPFIGGENAVLIMSFLSAQGILPLAVVVFFSFLAMITLDSIWFFIVKSKRVTKIKESEKISKYNLRLEARLEKVTNKQDILILLLSKILIGTRILIIIYLSLKKMSYKKFMLYNTPPTFLWACTLGLIGWFAGRGYYNLDAAQNNLLLAGVILLGTILFISLISYLLKKWLLKK
jgi:membrane protein DedA with SNARE-associated domain